MVIGSKAQNVKYCWWAAMWMIIFVNIFIFISSASDYRIAKSTQMHADRTSFATLTPERIDVLSKQFKSEKNNGRCARVFCRFPSFPKPAITSISWCTEAAYSWARLTSAAKAAGSRITENISWEFSFTISKELKLTRPLYKKKPTIGQLSTRVRWYFSANQHWRKQSHETSITGYKKYSGNLCVVADGFNFF